MQLSATPYEERLTAPRSWWFISFLVGLAMALVLLPFGTLPLLGGLVGGTAATAVMASSYGSVRIRVVGGSLIAGEAKIPVTALGEAEVLDQEEARAWRTYKADTRAFLLLRAYIPTALRVMVTDPEDPTPYLYLSAGAGASGRGPEGRQGGHGVRAHLRGATGHFPCPEGPQGPISLRISAIVTGSGTGSRAGSSGSASQETWIFLRSLRIRAASFLVSRRFMTAPTAAPTMKGMRFGRSRTMRFMICWRSSRFMWPFSAELTVDGLVTSIPRSPTRSSDTPCCAL